MHWARRSGIDPVQFLTNLLAYVTTNWSGNPLHPTHLTEKEQQIKQLRKRGRRAKTERKKQQIRDAIRDLQK